MGAGPAKLRPGPLHRPLRYQAVQGFAAADAPLGTASPASPEKHSEVFAGAPSTGAVSAPHPQPELQARRILEDVFILHRILPWLLRHCYPRYL